MDHQQVTRDNEAGVLAAELAGAEAVPGLPIKFNIEFTADCNIHCRMCDCEMTRQRCRRRGMTGFHMPQDVFRAAVNRVFPRCSIVNPSLVGEPLVLPYLDDLITAAREHAVRLDLVTNGVLLLPELSARLLPVLSGLMISVDGATRATFERIRNGARFDEVMANLAAFSRLRSEMGLESRIPLQFSTALMKENIRELPAIVELAARHRVDGIVASHLVVFRPELMDSSLVHTPDLAESYLTLARRRAAALGVWVRFPAPLHRGSATDLFKVSAGEATADEGEEAMEVGAEGAGEPRAKPRRPQPKVTPGAAPRGPSAAPTRPAAREEPPPPTAITECRPESWQGRYYCKFPWRETFVSLGGEVSPCCAQGRPVFGNALETDIEALWNGPDYRRLRRGLYTGDLTDYCRRCTYLCEAGYLDYDGSLYGRLEG